MRFTARRNWGTVPLTGMLLLLTVVLASAQTGKQGELQVDPHCAVDLDAGISECMVTLDGDGTEPPSHPSGQDHDFRLEPSGSRLYLQPRNGALIAKPTSVQPGLSGCVQARYSSSRLRVDGSPKDLYLCVQTNQRRYAELRIAEAIQPGAAQVIFRFRLLEK
ncbi:hypothetical protein [Paludibaculum fermentans]|uniref:Uncharacterized protein n=1 Tax=Paludibaculum fermentans TaxID=1473598 RepID=A0A7S7NU72_PALFE|nr:hypothetical protein [Paludibaculum fermentans]QOY89862.1 hypothetical protein IRI77_07880 [Paludibaculum fermentans]